MCISGPNLGASESPKPVLLALLISERKGAIEL